MTEENEKSVQTDELDDCAYMRRALELASKAEAEGEVPVGALVVYEGKIIGEGWNRLINEHDATAHAEMIALRQAGKTIGNYRLLDTVLYVTLEPCAMCASAMVHSRVNKVVYGAFDLKTGAAGSVMNLLSYAGVNHHVKSQGGVMELACRDKLQAFFRRRRAEIKAQKKENKEKK